MAPDTGTLQTSCADIEKNTFQDYEDIPTSKTAENIINDNFIRAEKGIDDLQNVSDILDIRINNNIIARDKNVTKIVEEERKSDVVNENKTVDKVEDGKAFKTSDEVIYVPRLRWPDLIAQTFLHAGCLYGFYLMLTAAKFYTTLFAFATVYTSGFGITAGAHRLWSHRAYKAKWPLRLILILLFTITGQRDVYTWALDHRVHHKYTETTSDPHDSRRGFFFSHVGWLFVTPHPDVEAKRKAVDVRDLEADPIVMWQKRWFIPLFAILSIGLPVMIPVWYWQETIWNSFWVNFNCRFTITLNLAFFVNSVAHMWGDKPYDKNISPVENLAVAIAALGEGWHNYHHVFPWDYKTGELGSYAFNLSTAFIDFFAKIGWAYDRKLVSSEMIARRAVKTGDGSYLIDHHHMQGPALWGYGDKDMLQVDADELEKQKDKDE